LLIKLGQKMNDDKVIKLWDNFLQDRSSDNRNSLVIEYLGLVNQVISHLSLPNHIVINRDDFKSVGIIALVDAIEKFEMQKGVKFETYAYFRIQGNIKDELRNFDLLSRNARKKVLDIYRTREELVREKNREVSIEEVRLKLDLNENQFKSYMQALDASNAFYSLSDINRSGGSDDEEFNDFLEEISDPNQENTLDMMEKAERKDFIYNYLQKLPRKKRLVLTFIYYEELNPKQISVLMGISESRISQIHSEVIKNLKTHLIKYDYV